MVSCDTAVDQSPVVPGDVRINVGTDTHEISVRNRVAVITACPIAFGAAEFQRNGRACIIALEID